MDPVSMPNADAEKANSSGPPASSNQPGPARSATLPDDLRTSLQKSGGEDGSAWDTFMCLRLGPCGYGFVNPTNPTHLHRCYEANGKCGCIKRQSACLCGEEGNMFKFDKTGNSIMCCMGKGVCCCQNFDQTCYLEGLITPEPENYCCKIRTGNYCRQCPTKFGSCGTESENKYCCIRHINNSGCLIPDVTFETGKCVLAEYEARACCCYMAETAVVKKELSGPEGFLSCIDKALCCFQDLAPIPGGVMAVLECCGIRILGPQKSKPVPGGFAAPWAKGGGGASATGANFGSAETPIAIVSDVTPDMVPQPLAML